MLIKISVAIAIVLDQLFDYYLDSSLLSNEDSIDSLIGRRVLVPFGNSRKLVAVILNAEPVHIKESIKPENNTSNNEISNNLKFAIKLIDKEAIFSYKMIQFLKWISNYYLAPIGEVFKAATPSTSSQETKIIVKLIEDNQSIINSKISNQPSLKTIVNFLINNNKTATYTKLKSIIKYNLKQKLNSLDDLEIIQINEVLPTIKKLQKKKYVRINQELITEFSILENEINSFEKKAPKRYSVLKFLLLNNPENKYISVDELIENTNSNNNFINTLVKLELLQIIEIEEKQTNLSEFKLANKVEIDIPLTEEQTNVFENILEKYQNNNLKPSLIFGVTGSGKTLIYMNIIKNVLKNEQSTIILLPEISLTPQFIDRFELSFPDQIAVIHSRISASDREKAYKDIQSGKSKIIIGARSALFAPSKNLGLIIVDEEHDSSFKQESPNPRYNARDSAVMRAKIENCSIILGSATPSVESMYNALNSKYDLYKIENRADNAKLPRIYTIDLLDSMKQGQTYNDTLSKTLLKEMDKRIAKKEGIILLQNRRGFASHIQCTDCGHIEECKNCSVILTYHKFTNRNKCHYCDYSEVFSKNCKNCGSSNLKITGSGTQKIEEDIKNYFLDQNKNITIERMDIDTTSKKGAHRKILERFAKGESDILIGTQMVAKGLDFSRVTMVGIINSDIQLMLPDFRANERTFQLLTQVAGRAGRNSDKEGEVYIQTYTPNNPAIKSVIKSSYFDFYNDEISSRKEALYPPFVRFNVIEFSSQFSDLVVKHSNIFYSLLKSHKSLIINPPIVPLIEKIRDRFRRIIIIKSIKSIDKNGSVLHNTIKNAYNLYNKEYYTHKIMIKLDLDANSGI